MLDQNSMQLLPILVNFPAGSNSNGLCYLNQLSDLAVSLAKS